MGCQCKCTCKKDEGGIPKSEVFALKSLVEYNPGAVVSRTLTNNNGGTITAFAFDEGQGLSEHSAPFDATVQILDGEVEISIADEINNLKEGDIIVMPANTPHSMKAGVQFKILLTMLKE